MDEIDIHEPPKKKKRIEQKYLKDHGMEHINRKGVTIPQNKFKELINCCRRKCDICSPDKQKIIFESFYKLEKEIQYQIMSCGITLIDKKSTRLGRGKYGISHDRLVTVLYVIQIENKNITVCKKMFQSVYGVTRGKIDLLIQKKKISDSGTLQQLNYRGHHEPHNKMTEEKEEIILKNILNTRVTILEATQINFIFNVI